MVKSENVLTAYFHNAPHMIHQTSSALDVNPLVCDLYLPGEDDPPLWKQSNDKPIIDNHIGFMMTQVLLSDPCSIFQSELNNAKSQFALREIIGYSSEGIIRTFIFYPITILSILNILDLRFTLRVPFVITIVCLVYPFMFTKKRLII